MLSRVDISLLVGNINSGMNSLLHDCEHVTQARRSCSPGLGDFEQYILGPDLDMETGNSLQLWEATCTILIYHHIFKRVTMLLSSLRGILFGEIILQEGILGNIRL